VEPFSAPQQAPQVVGDDSQNHLLFLVGKTFL
jgi:hypothetical protein